MKVKGLKENITVLISSRERRQTNSLNVVIYNSAHTKKTASTTDNHEAASLLNVGQLTLKASADFLMEL